MGAVCRAARRKRGLTKMDEPIIQTITTEDGDILTYQITKYQGEEPVVCDMCGATSSTNYYVVTPLHHTDEFETTTIECENCIADITEWGAL